MKNTRIRLFPRIRKRRGTLESEGQKGQRYCPNCHYPLPHYGEFCSNCGQRFTDGRVPLKYLLQDFLENVLNVDSKFFRTTWALIIPGKLTNEFFKGHHKRYATPGRLFFVATVVHFAVLGFLINDQIATGLGQMIEDGKRKSYVQPMLDSLQAARKDILTEFGEEPDVARAFDSLFLKVGGTSRDSQKVDYFTFADSWWPSSAEVWFSTQELYSKSPAELADAKGITGKMDRLVFQQVVKVTTHTDNFGQYALGQLVWMVILMMPALALILKLLYIRRKRYFVEHLVFSFHYHAFSFWIVSIMLLIMTWTNSWDNEAIAGIVPTFVVFGILIYLFIAMRRVYKQGFFKTFVKYNILNFAYIMIFSLFLALTLAVSALMF
ncbi:DUF3667 domain-containing protein [Flavilitoribacter nigricans]|uniref:DUF3667 domain-containing protein n=1 Tax=Flavilitoribacter nigricans (strain ATCC 23147 / DSM 23189 / NBRC 102662 / NCIMB 1420 / SS-2) TaxID=1122177 RepID=A0A2D0N811_FLAN2|nr:DUF3667 domain-containing protein [Flavilitoribacter nigricans]PHN04617.1 hypothetical protein CRP01_21685 [Flavilitoribacter nigricans DSM 23189 = NBRC 102662]